MRTGIRRMLLVLSLVLTLVTAAAFPVFAESAPATGTIASVAAKAKPSVVGILTTIKAVRSTEKSHAAGTGFVYKDGVIITNAHVVEDAVEVKVLYPDKSVETVPPSQIFSDTTADIAVLKVATKNLTPLPFADSDKVTVGMQVVAIGNPLGFRLGNSVSAGILSGTGRAMGSAYPFLQTDAPINPGNSGGPLFNLNGEVIGINSSKMADVGVEGLGFAIPGNTARQIADLLLKDGKVERATLGIALDEDWQAYFGVPNAEGVTIGSVIADSPVGKTALRPGDKLVKLDETPIYTSDDIYAFLTAHKPGDAITITAKRRGQVLQAKVTLASQDAMKKAAEEQGGQEVSGILIGLTPSQIQEAAEFGRQLSYGYSDLNSDYVASSGSDYAVLYTEYLYVARRVESAYEFGFTPGVGFQQSAAREIYKKVEIQFELESDRPGFLDGASFYLEQKDQRVTGDLFGPVTYTASPDGKVVIANLAVRFAMDKLNATDDVVATVQQKDGKAVTFHFTINDLR